MLKLSFEKIRILFVHIFVFFGIFYFLVHPFTMVLFWFESKNISYSYELFHKILNDRIIETFNFNMLGMSIWLTLFGGILGLISGLIWIQFKMKTRIIKKQEHLLKRDVQNLIELGENDRIEFKASIRYDYFRNEVNRELEIVIAKTIVGFMNSNGGKLLIGVDDKGEILGLENDYKTLKHWNKDGFERKLFEIISLKIGNEFCYNIHISFYHFNQSDICLVDIDPSLIPVYLIDHKNTTFYLRIGNSTNPLTVKETVEYLESKKSQTIKNKQVLN